MNIAQTIPLADGWSMHGGAGWWIPMMVLMVLFWAAVIFGIFWLARSAARGSSTPAERIVTRETPLETLDRRFAEGALSPDDYRAHREVLLNGAATNGAHTEEPLAAAPTGGGKQ